MPTSSFRIQKQEASLSAKKSVKSETQGQTSFVQFGTDTHWGNSGYIRLNSAKTKPQAEKKDQPKDTEAKGEDGRETANYTTVSPLRLRLQRILATGDGHDGSVR